MENLTDFTKQLQDLCNANPEALKMLIAEYGYENIPLDAEHLAQVILALEDTDFASELYDCATGNLKYYAGTVPALDDEVDPEWDAAAHETGRTGFLGWLKDNVGNLISTGLGVANKVIGGNSSADAYKIAYAQMQEREAERKKSNMIMLVVGVAIFIVVIGILSNAKPEKR